MAGKLLGQKHYKSKKQKRRRFGIKSERRRPLLSTIFKSDWKTNRGAHHKVVCAPSRGLLSLLVQNHGCLPTPETPDQHEKCYAKEQLNTSYHIFYGNTK